MQTGSYDFESQLISINYFYLFATNHTIANFMFTILKLQQYIHDIVLPNTDNKNQITIEIVYTGIGNIHLF